MNDELDSLRDKLFNALVREELLVKALKDSNEKFADLSVKLKAMSKYEDRIKTAADMAYRFVSVDGNNHKMWVIDQMLRSMLGESGYTDFVARCENNDDYEIWDVGIPP